jgi:hypothetical protein
MKKCNITKKHYMKKLKQLLISLLFLCSALCANAQAEVTVVENNGTTSTIVVSNLGKIYFSAERMYIDAGDGTVSDFAVSDIQKLTFNSLYTGVNQLEHQSSVLIYPNPATNFFKIAAESEQTLHVQLFSLTGQLLTDTYCQTDEAVNISELQSGIYFVKVNGATFKLLKK